MFSFAEGGHKGSGPPSPFMSPVGHKGTRETSLIIRSTRPRIFMTQIFMEGNFISARKIGRGERSRLFRYPYRKRVLGTPGKIYELSDDTNGKWEISLGVPSFMLFTFVNLHRVSEYFDLSGSLLLVKMLINQYK